MVVQPIDVGSRKQLFMDDKFIERVRPAPQEGQDQSGVCFDHPHLLLDDWGLAEIEGITFRIHPPQVEEPQMGQADRYWLNWQNVEN